MSTSTPIQVGAEPISITEGTHGVLLLHGFVGTPQEVRDLAMAFARHGFAVEVPLYPGHGTTFEEILTTGWSDYMQCAEQAYLKLAAQHPQVIVGGLSLGGTLAAWLATQYPTIAGLISINGIFRFPDYVNRELLQQALSKGVHFFPTSKYLPIRKPQTDLLSYGKTPLAPMVSNLEGVAKLVPHLKEITCPVLTFTSLLDRSAPDSNRLLIDGVAGPVENIVLEQSDHVATLDYDKEIIEARAVEFATTITQKKSL